MKKLVILLLLLFLVSCSPSVEINKETCKDYCDDCEICTELNKDTCNEFCEECTEINEVTCKDYCPACPEINEVTCKDYCPACPEINEETCKDYCEENTGKKKIYLGIDLIDQNLSLFKDKRVGLITNPTGVNSEYQSTIDVLYSKVNLVSLFAPEHGIRGNAQAGGSVGNEIDSVTGLTVYSLYGNTKEPTAEMMAGVDVLCIDIQDVGARFYTYIYTMVHAMKACAKYNKTFVVFDRPNPISNKVDGNILNMKHSSFVGEYDIITQHGLTIGELAGLFNSEYNINCDLKVIKMKDYDPSLYIDETTTPWVNPSPNMPTLDTAIVYTGTCLFEGVNLSEGRGTTKPFEFIGAPFIDAKAWADKLNSLGLEGVTFRPIYFTPTFEDYANTLCGGVQPHVTDRDKFSACKTALAMIYTIKELYPSQVKLQSYLKTLSGVDYIYNMTYTLDELFDIIDKDISEFNKIRAKYVLYE